MKQILNTVSTSAQAWLHAHEHGQSQILLAWILQHFPAISLFFSGITSQTQSECMPNASEQIEREIKSWIQQATEPKDKALLMILFQMNTNLTENTFITKGVAADFHAHKGRIDGLLNRARGGWFALAIAFVVIQGLGLFVFNQQLNLAARESLRNELQEAAIIVMQAEHRDVNRRLNALESWRPSAKPKDDK